MNSTRFISTLSIPWLCICTKMWTKNSIFLHSELHRLQQSNCLTLLLWAALGWVNSCMQRLGNIWCKTTRQVLYSCLDQNQIVLLPWWNFASLSLVQFCELRAWTIVQFCELRAWIIFSTSPHTRIKRPYRSIISRGPSKLPGQMGCGECRNTFYSAKVRCFSGSFSNSLSSAVSSKKHIWNVNLSTHLG